MRGKLGTRQRQMLEKMIRYGEGFYLPEWRLDYAENQMLESLLKRGLIRRALHHSGVWAWQVVPVPEARPENGEGD